MSVEILREALPEPMRKHLDPALPVPARIMAANGLLPLPPREMIIVVCGLALDPDERLRTAAQNTLKKLPDKILAPALSVDLPPPAYGVLAPSLVDREPLLEKIVLNRQTPDETLASIAATVSERLAEIIAGNQERCLRSQSIVNAVRTNPHLPLSSVDRLFDFLVRAGVIYEGMPEYTDALARLSPTEMKDAAEKVVIPEAVHALLVESEETAQKGESTAQALEENLEEAKEKIPVLKLINGLNVAQKMALAIRGNREARVILVRDSNRVVAVAAINNPRVTEQEVVAAAQSRQVNDDVVRVIANSKEMTRNYMVKVALVNNPKTPLQTAMRFLPLLRASDLNGVSKSKNVTSALANQAKRLVQSKTNR